MIPVELKKLSPHVHTSIHWLTKTLSVPCYPECQRKLSSCNPASQPIIQDSTVILCTSLENAMIIAEIVTCHTSKTANWMKRHYPKRIYWMDGMVWLCDIAVAEGGTHHFARLVQILLMNTITSKIRMLAIPLLLSAGKLRRTLIFFANWK